VYQQISSCFSIRTHQQLQFIIAHQINKQSNNKKLKFSALFLEAYIMIHESIMSENQISKKKLGVKVRIIITSFHKLLSLDIIA
jgi:hypothetical protein